MPARSSSVPAGSEAAGQIAVRLHDLQRDVAVPDEHERRARELERGQGGLVAEDVLPDRVARRAVVQRDAVRGSLRLRAGREAPSTAASSTSRVQSGRDRGVAVELLEVDRPAHREVVVAGEADVGPLRDRGAALVRPRPVADEVAETPELVRRLRVDRRQDRVQRVQVRVDVGDDRDAHGRTANANPARTGTVAATSEVTRRSRPQRPATIPVMTAAASLRFPATTTPSSAGASRSSQPMSAEPKVACCRLGSDMPAAWGSGTFSSVFVACCTPVVPQTRMTSSAARPTSPRGSTRRARPSLWPRRPRGRRARSATAPAASLHEPVREPRHDPERSGRRGPEPPARAARGRARRSRRAPASRTSRAGRARGGHPERS